MARKKQVRAESILDWLGVRAVPDWRVARPLGGIVSFVLGLLFIAALAAAFVMLAQVAGGGAASLGAGALIVAVLSAPFLIWNTYIRHRALGFQKEGHLTDRLAKAVEQLGAEKTVKKIVTGPDGVPVTQETTEPNLEVRIGGLLSLERIAQDSTAYDKGRDHVRVMEIICAYVRNNANMSSENTSHTKKDSELRQDIMIALSVIGRRSYLQLAVEAAQSSRLSYEKSTGPFSRSPVGRGKSKADSCHFEPTDLVHLEYHPNLRRVSLRGAKLQFTQLGGANFQGSDLRKVDFWHARLDCADMSRVLLDEADFTNASLKGAAFKRVDLSKVKSLTAAQLETVFGDASVDCMGQRPEHWPSWDMPGRVFFQEWRRWQSDPENYTPLPSPPANPPLQPGGGAAT